jgi:hypothetical protein
MGKKITDGLNLKISEILNESYIDIHGHEITFEKQENSNTNLFIILTVIENTLLICHQLQYQ